MTTRQQRLLTVAIVTISFLLTTCRKELPSSDLEKIFGTWVWVKSYGGEGGQTWTPATVGYSRTVEFDKNRICKWYKDGELVDKKKFILTEGSSISNINPAYLIKYKDTKLFKNKDYTTQLVLFGGQDTLFLNDEVYDGFNDIYTRQK